MIVILASQPFDSTQAAHVTIPVFFFASYARDARHQSNCSGLRHQSRFCASVTAMSSQTVYDLSIPELLRVLNEKLGLKCVQTREICLPPILGSISSLEAEVSGPWTIYPNERGIAI